jgi:hypothetical protein
MDLIAFYNTSFLLSTVTFKPSYPDAFKGEKRTALMLIVFQLISVCSSLSIVGSVIMQ